MSNVTWFLWIMAKIVNQNRSSAIFTNLIFVLPKTTKPNTPNDNSIFSLKSTTNRLQKCLVIFLTISILYIYTVWLKIQWLSTWNKVQFSSPNFRRTSMLLKIMADELLCRFAQIPPLLNNDVRQNEKF